MASTFNQVQESLAPYIRSRKEVSHIREVLAAHLDSHLNSAGKHSKGPVLSLVHDSTSVKSIPGTVPRLRKDYLKALRADVKARCEYTRVCNTKGVFKSSLAPRDATSDSPDLDTNLSIKSDHLDGYLDLIKQRQRQERLRILQDYLDKLERRAAATTSYLNRVNPPLLGLSQIPVEIATSSASVAQESDENVLKDLMKGLEQAVLLAKVRLKNKKNSLQLVKKGNYAIKQDKLSHNSRDGRMLQALGRTRNELINWIEEELGKAGDSDLRDAPGTHLQSHTEGNESIDNQLVLVRAQYSQYVQARKTLINTIAETAEPALADSVIGKKEGGLEDIEMESSPLTTWIISPFLRDLQLISNEQKSAIQQKSHLTVSLAKHHKENVQLFDRLAHESHLLPAFPLKNSRKDHFDLDEMAEKEMPSALHRARAWTHAAECANSATNESVIASLEEGESALERARNTLFALEGLLGRRSCSKDNSLKEDDIWTYEQTSSILKSDKSNQTSTSAPSIHGDIWAALDGNLGVL